MDIQNIKTNLRHSNLIVVTFQLQLFVVVVVVGVRLGAV